MESIKGFGGVGVSIPVKRETAVPTGDKDDAGGGLIPPGGGNGENTKAAAISTNAAPEFQITLHENMEHRIYSGQVTSVNKYIANLHVTERDLEQLGSVTDSLEESLKNGSDPTGRTEESMARLASLTIEFESKRASITRNLNDLARELGVAPNGVIPEEPPTK